MNNDKINIVFSINDVYAKFCAVTIASIQSNCKEGINFYVISKNVNSVTKKTGPTREF